MAPRTYTLGRRAKTSADTRERIIEAAAAVYREHGVPGATIQAIAERADVARGTVLNHFGGADGLLEAVLDRAAEEVNYPTERDLAGAATPEDRIRRFVDTMFRFFERSVDWWAVFAADIEVPAIRARERAYWEEAGRFQAAAFGSLAGEPYVAAAVRAFVDYAPLNSLRSAGLTLEQAIELVGDVLIDVVRRRANAEGGSE
jgi:AcrR family transcriptional regulator